MQCLAEKCFQEAFNDEGAQCVCHIIIWIILGALWWDVTVHSNLLYNALDASDSCLRLVESFIWCHINRANVISYVDYITLSRHRLPRYLCEYEESCREMHARNICESGSIVCTAHYNWSIVHGADIMVVGRERLWEAPHSVLSSHLTISFSSICPIMHHHMAICSNSLLMSPSFSW